MRFSGALLFVILMTACGHLRRHPDDAKKRAIVAGQAIFRANCNACHDSSGGNLRAPDLRLSTLVSRDVNGNILTPMVRIGRPALGMPAFPDLKASEISDLSAYLHDTGKGFRPVSDPSGARPQGNPAKGKAYFVAECSGCHSASGDLAGIGSKYSAFFLKRRVLYPDMPDASTADVTLPDGSHIQGRVVADDEFNISLVSQDGWYRTLSREKVKVEIQDRLAAHRALLDKYTNSNIEDVVAYLYTLK